MFPRQYSYNTHSLAFIKTSLFLMTMIIIKLLHNQIVGLFSIQDNLRVLWKYVSITLFKIYIDAVVVLMTITESLYKQNVICFWTVASSGCEIVMSVNNKSDTAVICVVTVYVCMYSIDWLIDCSIFTTTDCCL